MLLLPQRDWLDEMYDQDLHVLGVCESLQQVTFLHHKAFHSAISLLGRNGHGG
jgi:hypothetical protein